MVGRTRQDHGPPTDPTTVAGIGARASPSDGRPSPGEHQPSAASPRIASAALQFTIPGRASAFLITRRR